MINLRDVRYVRLGTSDLDQCERYATQILGLEKVRGTARSVYLRADHRDHTIMYFKGDPADHTVGWDIDSAAELDAAAAELEANGIQVHRGSASQSDERACAAFINFRDPNGSSHDLVVRGHSSGVRYFPARDAGIWAFSHIGLHTRDPLRDERFWTTLLSAKVSDRIGDAALLRIDEVHHKIALFPSKRIGVQHINHQVHDVNDIMRSYYFLREQGVKIVFGPGRHPTSGAMFLYFEVPDGMIYEYSTGVRMITLDDEKTYRPRQFPFEPSSLCMWGARPDIAEFKEDKSSGEQNAGTNSNNTNNVNSTESIGRDHQGTRRAAA